MPGDLSEAHKPQQSATPRATSTHRNPLAQVPAGQLLGNVERLPHVRVVEVVGGGRGVGAGGVQVHLLPRTQQRLGGGHRGSGYWLPCPAVPPRPCWEEAWALAHLMPHPLEWQAGEDVAQILDHDSVLLMPASAMGGNGCLGPQIGLGLANRMPGRAYLTWLGTPPAHGA